jgi:hypothetical protein
VRIGVTDSAGHEVNREVAKLSDTVLAERPNPVSFRLCFVPRVLWWHRRSALTPFLDDNRMIKDKLASK